MSFIPLEHSHLLELPEERYRPLMKSLNRHYARLKGLAVTEESPIITVQTVHRNTHEETGLDLAVGTQSDENNEEMLHVI